jgi:hypothetical protein
MAGGASSFRPVNETVQERYEHILRWFLARQHRNGSWGSGNDKLTYTAQAIQVMHAAGFERDEKRVKKARRWLEDHANKQDKHRFSRLEVALLLGDLPRQESDSAAHELRDFLGALDSQLTNPAKLQIEDFFLWHALPTLIAMRPYEEELRKAGLISDVPHDKVMGTLQSITTVFVGGGRRAVWGQPNHTGLAALYLHSIRDVKGLSPDPGELSNSMVEWLIEDRATGLDFGWDHSHGITSYVLIDLVGVGADEHPDIRGELPEIVQFLAPSSGPLPGDRRITFATALHTQPLYATALALRALSTVMSKYQPDDLRRCRSNAERMLRERSLPARAMDAARRRGSALPWALAALPVVLAAILWGFDASELGAMFGSAGIGALLALGLSRLQRNN